MENDNKDFDDNKTHEIFRGKFEQMVEYAVKHNIPVVRVKLKKMPLEGYEGIRERPKFLDDFIEE